MVKVQLFPTKDPEEVYFYITDDVIGEYWEYSIDGEMENFKGWHQLDPEIKAEIRELCLYILAEEAHYTIMERLAESFHDRSDCILGEYDE